MFLSLSSVVSRNPEPEPLVNAKSLVCSESDSWIRIPNREAFSVMELMSIVGGQIVGIWDRLSSKFIQRVVFCLFLPPHLFLPFFLSSLYNGTSTLNYCYDLTEHFIEL
jgi:hypothetical protein